MCAVIGGHATSRRHFRVTTHLLAHLATDLAKTGLAVLALGLQSAVTEHLDDLSVLCACKPLLSRNEPIHVSPLRNELTLSVLLEDELALVLVTVILPTYTVSNAWSAEKESLTGACSCHPLSSQYSALPFNDAIWGAHFSFSLFR